MAVATDTGRPGDGGQRTLTVTSIDDAVSPGCSTTDTSIPRRLWAVSVGRVAPSDSLSTCQPAAAKRFAAARIEEVASAGESAPMTLEARDAHWAGHGCCACMPGIAG